MPPVGKTHHGRFHTDEVFGGEEVRKKYPSLVIIRGPRTKEFFQGADFLIDIGREYDPKAGKFDHHQGDAPLREPGVPFSSFGLVFRYFRQESLVKQVIDQDFVRFIDRSESPKASEDRDRFGLSASQMMASLNPNWLEEEQEGFKAYDKRFVHAQAFAREAMGRLEAHAGTVWKYAADLSIAKRSFQQALREYTGVDVNNKSFVENWEEVCEKQGYSALVREKFIGRVAKAIDSQQEEMVANKYGVHEFFSLYAPLPFEDGKVTLRQGILRAKQVIDRDLTEIVLLEQATTEIAQTITPQDHYLLLPKRRPYYEVIKQFPNIEYVLAQEDDQGWIVISPAINGKRKNLLPLEWRGKADKELAAITKVPGAVFCHTDGFIAKASSLDGAYRLADRALELIK